MANKSILQKAIEGEGDQYARVASKKSFRPKGGGKLRTQVTSYWGGDKNHLAIIVTDTAGSSHCYFDEQGACALRDHLIKITAKEK